MRNFSLALENSVDSVGKASAAQQKSSDFLAKVVLDSRIILSQTIRCLCLLTPPSAALGLTLLGKLQFSYIKALNKALGLKRCYQRGFIDWFGFWGPCHQSTFLTVAIILFIMIIMLLSCWILSKYLNACFLTTKQGLMHQKKNKESS